MISVPLAYCIHYYIEICMADIMSFIKGSINSNKCALSSVQNTVEFYAEHSELVQVIVSSAHKHTALDKGL